MREHDGDVPGARDGGKVVGNVGDDDQGVRYDWTLGTAK
jgi:hypothetical protein